MKPIQVKTRHYAGQDEFIHIIDRNIDGEYLVVVDAHDGCYTEILSEAQISDNWGIEDIGYAGAKHLKGYSATKQGEVITHRYENPHDDPLEGLADVVKKTSELVSIWQPVIPIDPTHDGFILTENDGEHRNYTKVVGKETYSVSFWGNSCLIMSSYGRSPEWDTLFKGDVPNQYAFQMILKMILKMIGL